MKLPDRAWNRGETLCLPFDGASLAYFLSDFERAFVLVPHAFWAGRLVDDLLLLGGKALSLPDPRFETGREDEALLLRRGALWRQWLDAGGVLVLTPASLCTPLKTGEGALAIQKGQRLGRDSLLGWLEAQGYQKRSLVWNPGDYACRGSVVDLYDPTASSPLRVEFFDEDVEELRAFSPKTQRTFKVLSQTLVSSLHTGKGRLEGPLGSLPLGEPRLLVAPEQLESAFEAFRLLWRDLKGDELPLQSWDEVLTRLADGPRLRVEERDGHPSGLFLPPFFKGDLAAARRWVATARAGGQKVKLASSALSGPEVLGEGVELLSRDSLSGGFVSSEDGLVLLTDNELFGLQSRRTDEASEPPAQLALALQEGQWVIHERYGLCQFLGMGQESFGGEAVETVLLGFADDKKLIIPVADLERLTLWDGDGDPVPDKLGGKRWTNARVKTEEQIRREASELLTIQARRALTPGRAYEEPGELFSRFLQTFPHRETKDQLQAWREIASDMSRPFPMDRLLVGDVGNGKTEVALRAAVLAMEQGAQVAFVAPTTVLVNQHYHTATRRMAELPFRVAQLSRLVGGSKQKVIKEELAAGSVDLVIGTHTLLKKGLNFKNLGLLIIDEEHRFGVAHKESLKEAYPGVDVLSLSATPIPRTLSMGLRGLKDISRIATAPASRGQVFTVSGPWEERLVRQALGREFARGGQAYYLYNRVEDIDQLAGRLRGWFPDVRVAVAHGQMPHAELEDVMERFARGKVDLLVCTTLVESGLDVGAANTLIVDDTRTLGLAQMHQIRGRIGRREQNAFAYFLYPCPERDLPLTSRERLEALGALESDNGGYRLALRDLEIRGAGEILGSNQSGFKNRVGYTLYYKMLREKIAELQGGAVQKVRMTLHWTPSLAPSYLSDSAERVGLYRHLAAGLSLQECDDLKVQLRDRCGPLPREFEAALALAALRREGFSSGLRELTLTRGSAEVKLAEGVLPPKGFVRRGEKWIGRGESEGLLALGEWLRKERGDEGL